MSATREFQSLVCAGLNAFALTTTRLDLQQQQVRYGREVIAAHQTSKKVIAIERFP
jgi:hypothetical protein